jgi:8-oxo-dGTP diphosphatase
MASRDGNGWIHCALGHQHWGRFGAAGLLAYVGDTGSPGSVLLQHRAVWSHYGGTWGLPGGARDSHESAQEAALREAAEECGVAAGAVAVRGIFTDDHGGWAYHTVLACAAALFEVHPASEETDDVAWVAVDGTQALELHPGFAEHWDQLRAGLAPLTVIVDAANVVGSRPDGWWRDRAGAARRLLGEVGWLAERGVAAIPGALGLPAPTQWFPEFVVVLEGQARGAELGGAAVADGGRVRVVSAPGSGDDTIARLAGELTGWRLVVTADRGLRSRCEDAGALVTGPRWLIDLLRP